MNIHVQGFGTDIFPTVLGSILGSWVVQSCDWCVLVFLSCHQTAFKMMPFWILWQRVSSRSPGFSLAFGQLSGAVLVCRWWGKGSHTIGISFSLWGTVFSGCLSEQFDPTYLCWSVHFKSFALLVAVRIMTTIEVLYTPSVWSPGRCALWALCSALSLFISTVIFRKHFNSDDDFFVPVACFWVNWMPCVFWGIVTFVCWQTYLVWLFSHPSLTLSGHEPAW